MIYISGAPRTGKTTLARCMYGTVLHTDHYLHLPHREQTTAIWKDMQAGGASVVEGCTVDRLIKHGLVPPGTVLLCTGFKVHDKSYAALAARAKKYYSAFEGNKYTVTR